MPDFRVLVVDDSRDMREFVARYILEPHGFEPLEAADGVEGMQYIAQDNVDLVLLDLEMPRMSGFEMLDALHSRGCKTPVILMTSHGSEKIAVEVFRKGVRDYIIKPFAAEEMLVAIERALREVQLQREKEMLTQQLIQANQQLEQRLQEFNALYQIGKSVTALLDRDRLLERILDATLYITGAEGSAIMLDDGTGGLQECLRRQRTAGEERQVSRRTEEQLAADALHKRDATMTGAMLCAPLKVGERAIGVLSVSNKVTARFFDKHDQRLLMALADYAAIAIENARLLQQVEQAKEREKGQIRGLFERYVAPSVVERLVAQPEAVALGGVRQQATILFADIRGFSEFSVRASPEVLVNALNHHIGVAAEAILAEAGTLDKFLGDGVMAYFNAPLPQPDHVVRAVRAAWRVCQAAAESRSRPSSISPLQFGIGISTGEVVVGNIGAPQMMSFTVIGDAVNVSRRLQECARGGQILISQQVYRQVYPYVEARPVGMIEFKGHPQPEPAFEVLSLRGQ